MPALRFILVWSALLYSSTFGHSTPSASLESREKKNPLVNLKPKIVELARSNEQLFHEGAIYHAPTKALWVNSDGIKTGNDTTIYMQRITGLDSPDTVKIERIDHTIPRPIGGVRFIKGTKLGDVLMFVAQGTSAKTPPAGVYAMNPHPPYNSSLVIGSYGDYPYNSPDDMTVTPDGTILFTDPPYGFGQAGRPLPILPNQVYSYNPFTKDNRVVADGFGRPNGIATNLDGSRIYIGDTGGNIGNGTFDLQGPRTIYVYDKCGPMLSNRRVFAMPSALKSGPDGIKVDTKGNVWSGVNQEGVVVWSPDGTQLASIALKGLNVGNIGFGEPGELFVCAGKYLYKLILPKEVIGVNP